MQPKLAAAFGISLTAIVALILAGCGGKAGGGNTGATTASSSLPDLISASLIVDVNGDGKNDVIIGSQGGGLASPIVLINNGNGSSFTKSTTAIPSQYLGVNGATVDIQAGDFNKDGKMDLLTVTVDTGTGLNFYGDSQIQLFLGNGNGTFTDATANITSGAWPAWPASIATCSFIVGTAPRWTERVRVADIDGDGSLDFVTTSSGNGGGTVYRNDGTGKFSPATITLTNGASTFTSVILQTNTVSGCNVADLLVGDVNIDGKLDLVSPSEGATYINTSNPGVISFTVKANSIPNTKNGVLVDINGDGFLDAVGSLAIGTQVPVDAYINDSTGVFTLNNTVFLSAQPAVTHARQWLAADFNGDGKQDVLILDHGLDNPPFPGARNWLLFNNGANKLADVTATNLDVLPGYTHQAAIGDLNGDGKLDIILNNASCNGTTLTCANEPRFWLNDGTGKFVSYNPTIQ